jgi:hypothetical protein
MRLVPLAILALLLTGLVALDASAQTAKNKTKKKGTPLVDASSSSVLTDPLVPADLLAKLKLSATQKPEADKLLREFAAKLKDIAAKAQADSVGDSKAAKDKGKGKNKGGSTATSPAISAAVDLRDEYEQKFEDLLTEPQKKILEDYRVKQGEAALKASGKK